MDSTIDHFINHGLRAHPLLDAVLSGFSSWGVTLFGVAAFALWLFDRPGRAGTFRRACAVFVAYRAGRVFLLWATLIALSRVLVGVHYPTDVLASLVVGVAAGFLSARVLMGPLLEPLIRLVGRVTDPVLEPIEHARLVRSTLGSARVRSIAIGLIGIVLLLIFAVRLGGPLLDEMPLLALALWGLVVAGAAYVARLEPAQRRRL